MGNWISNLIEQFGYFGVAFLMFLENVFPPIPSELIMPLSGYVAKQGKMTLWGVIIAGTLGSWLGQIPLYYLGKYLGSGCLKRWLGRHPWLAVSPSELDKAEKWFERYGSKAVLFGRLVPAIRTLISLPAGICGMSMPKFLTYTGIGTCLWTGLLGAAGWFLGEKNTVVEQYLHPVSTGIFVIIAVFYVWRVAKRLYERRRESKGGAGAA